MGYRQIYIVGADHSWTRTLDVDSENRVVSVQPHFYKEDEKERQRVTALYKTIPLHQMLESLTTAFRSYHVIADYANRAGYEIYNSTPQSFIDAFPRRPITDCEARD